MSEETHVVCKSPGVLILRSCMWSKLTQLPFKYEAVRLNSLAKYNNKNYIIRKMSAASEFQLSYFSSHLSGIYFSKKSSTKRTC
jgi:hypothetical protein